MRRRVLIILDGAADRLRIDGRSPLGSARTPYLDAIARDGCTGLMTTLYDDLPRESLVAFLGMLGWDPHTYYPGGRASSELRAVPHVTLGDGDLVFRANLVRVEAGQLASFSADSIDTETARSLVADVNVALRAEFSELEMYHVGDYRTLLVARGAGLLPNQVACREPHESEGLPVQPDALIEAVDATAAPFARRLNAYLLRAASVLRDARANAVMPWGQSKSLRLPAFSRVAAFDGRAVVIGAMPFLSGVCAAGGIDYRMAGNGRPDSDFAEKARGVIDALDAGYEFVCCHVNAPDEASHLHDPALKVRCLERIDAELIKPVFQYLQASSGTDRRLMVTPDHYSNSAPTARAGTRREVHSLEPVPFAVWGGPRDQVATFDEDAARGGRYGTVPTSHLDLLDLLDIRDLAGRAVKSG
ncbi:MAG: 2,3-bisphosphoglycerate-independent phosphoglycerate mutase, archaeal form [Gemmatimonadetes bacterium]|nr:2,3-bisphosphoglycerate-independent phosphoglycerate mutase, archaeal form [Gemmatimonadota bacterium]